MRSQLLSLFLIVSFSCTLIEDDDIETKEELHQLTLSGFRIEQSRTNTTPLISTLAFDSAVSIVDPNYNKVVKRIKYFSAPEMGGKMKYRSGASGSGLEFYSTYLEDDVPYTFILLKGDSILEWYRFRYDANDKLTRITTLINPIDGLPPTVATIDDFTYDEEGEISSVERSSELAGQAGTFSEFMMNPYNDKVALGGFKFQNLTLYGQPCSGTGSNNCRFYYTNYASNSGYTPGVNVSMKTTNALGTTAKVILVEDDFNNTGSGNGGGGCCREVDHYFFHPLMMWQGLMENDDILLGIYMVDWIEPGAQITNNSGPGATPETLTLLYNYDR
jgi:hypothetical protein